MNRTRGPPKEFNVILHIIYCGYSVLSNNVDDNGRSVLEKLGFVLGLLYVGENYSVKRVNNDGHSRTLVRVHDDTLGHVRVTSVSEECTCDCTSDEECTCEST